MALAYVKRWCSRCDEIQLSLRTRRGYICEVCYQINTGKHPAESSQVIKELDLKLREELQKNINRKRIFPQVDHGHGSQWTTCVSQRSRTIHTFKRKKFTST